MESEAYKSNDVSVALSGAYLGLDDLLSLPEHRDELMALRATPGEEEEEPTCVWTAKGNGGLGWAGIEDMFMVLVGLMLALAWGPIWRAGLERERGGGGCSSQAPLPSPKCVLIPFPPPPPLPRLPPHPTPHTHAAMRIGAW